MHDGVTLGARMTQAVVALGATRILDLALGTHPPGFDVERQSVSLRGRCAGEELGAAHAVTPEGGGEGEVRYRRVRRAPDERLIAIV